MNRKGEKFLSIPSELTEYFYTLPEVPPIAYFRSLFPSSQSSHLTFLPGGFLSDSTSLQRVSLYNNDLTSLPEGFLSDSTSLQKVFLSDNALTSLPEGFLSDCTNLQRVDLSGNRLTSLPEGFLSDCIDLKEVDLRGNRLTVPGVGPQQIVKGPHKLL